ncbi:hypothetical protein AB5I41_01320 [Sphingomonas sp. MMS24-JH45]
MSFEYAQVNPLYFSDREEQDRADRGRDQLNLVENTLGEPAAGNGIPDNAFLRNVTNIGISTGGAFVSTCSDGRRHRRERNATSPLAAPDLHRLADSHSAWRRRRCGTGPWLRLRQFRQSGGEQRHG